VVRGLSSVGRRGVMQRADATGTQASAPATSRFSATSSLSHLGN
jgi:hypothetical protein